MKDRPLVCQPLAWCGGAKQPKGAREVARRLMAGPQRSAAVRGCRRPPTADGNSEGRWGSAGEPPCASVLFVEQTHHKIQFVLGVGQRQTSGIRGSDPQLVSFLPVSAHHFGLWQATGRCWMAQMQGEPMVVGKLLRANGDGCVRSEPCILRV